MAFKGLDRLLRHIPSPAEGWIPDVLVWSREANGAWPLISCQPNSLPYPFTSTLPRVFASMMRHYSWILPYVYRLGERMRGMSLSGIRVAPGFSRPVRQSSPGGQRSVIEVP